MSNTTLLIAAIVAIIALLGLVLLLRKPTPQAPAASARPASPAAPAAPAATAAPRESHGLTDSAAAAVLDVSGLGGADAHPDRPADDLTRIKGLGPKAQAMLNGIGIHRYAQLADLDPAQANELDGRLGTFKGRIFRDRWIDQARYLEQNDIAGFEAEFGKLG